jgi:hypothetical protein
MEKYEEMARKEIEEELKNCGMPKSMIASALESTVQTRMDWMRSMDRCEYDGKVA